MVGQLSRRLLLVEDDLPVQKLIARHLLAAGYVVRTAVDGLDAVAKLRAGLPYLIISDLNMPGMGGIEFLNVVRKRFPQIPVIAISGVSKDEIPQGLAADAYWCKNGSGGFPDLLATVADLAGQPAPRASAPSLGHEPVQARWNGNSYYVLGCDECLREFSVSRVFHRGQSEKWATCTHCGKLLQFVVAAVPHLSYEL